MISTYGEGGYYMAKKMVVEFDIQKVVKAIIEAINKIDIEIENLSDQSDLCIQEYCDILNELLIKRERFQKSLRYYTQLQNKSLLSKLKSFLLRFISRKKKHVIILESIRIIDIFLNIYNNTKSFIGKENTIHYKSLKKKVITPSFLV